ncbi:MAG: hypothetical protein ACFFDI_25865 [Promethearchaeota archaeon]
MSLNSSFKRIILVLGIFSIFIVIFVVATIGILSYFFLRISAFFYYYYTVTYFYDPYSLLRVRIIVISIYASLAIVAYLGYTLFDKIFDRIFYNRCDICGAEISREAEICEFCGSRVKGINERE